MASFQEDLDDTSQVARRRRGPTRERIDENKQEDLFPAVSTSLCDVDQLIVRKKLSADHAC